ncbi:MAG: replicative DNA helicase, partial [Duodenibacillus sp.]|nr:replicative DNA helicase [Duodenibacillus sp.]
ADPAVAAVRRPPQSVESEQCILGGLMLENGAFDAVGDLLRPDDFYRGDHKLIYEKICEMVGHGKPVDAITVYEEFHSVGRDQEVGGLLYLNSLVNATPSAANIRRYAEIVRERSLLRQLVAAGDKIATSALAPETNDVNAILDAAQAEVFRIGESNSRGQSGFQPLEKLSAEVTELLHELYERRDKGDVTGLPTGFIDLDRMTSGLQPGDLVIVAGRPSMGKTAFAMNIAEHAGLNLRLPVAVFSMEMSGAQLTKRLISSMGRISAQKMRNGRFDDEDWQLFTEAVARIGDRAFYIDDTPGLTISEVRSRSRRLARRTGSLSLIVVDYLQLMSGSAKQTSTENRATEISEISRGLKGLAKELNCPVIALSQLNRSV